MANFKINEKPSGEGSKMEKKNDNELLNTEILNILEHNPENFNSGHSENKIIAHGKLKKKKTKNLKKITSSKISHSEFIAFSEPFISTMTDKKFRDVIEKTSTAVNLCNTTTYDTFKDSLRTRLSAAYTFTEQCNLESVEYPSELSPKKQVFNLKEDNSFSPDAAMQFFIHNKILEPFLLKNSMQVIKEHIRTVERNNKKKKLLKAAIRKRARFRGYIKFYEMLQKELLSIYTKRLHKKKRKIEEFEEETVVEYARRIEEFLEEFGEPDQFNDYEMIYDDIFDDESIEFEYLR
ncbi:hypothetical protein NUSPORA_00129 [Nucleospora cyclopteri]